MSQTAPLAAPKSREQIRALGGARAVPALLIVLFHYCEGNGYRGAQWFDLFVGKGFLWVEFFFALSGFILIHVYGPAPQELFNARGYGQFLVKRLARIYPVHVAMLLALLALEIGLRAAGWPPNPQRDAFSFLTNLLLVQAWNIHDQLTWNWPAWFVSVEFLLYLTFPVFLLLRRAWWLLIPAGVLGLAALAATSGYGLDITFHNGILRGACAFAIGAGFSSLFAQARASGKPALRESLHSIGQLLMLVVLLALFYLGGRARTAMDAATVLPILGFVFLLAFDRGVLARLCRAPTLQRVGEWSLGIYMVHFPLLQLLQLAKQTFYSPSGQWAAIMLWLEPAIIVALSLLGGWALWRFVERPLGDRFRRLTQWIGPAGA